MTRTYVGLGSNLESPRVQLQRALSALGRLRATELREASSFYVTAPMGGPPQPDFVNAAAQLETGLTACELLDELHGIERSQGRRRDGGRWEPRTLDLDLLLYGEDRIMQDGLIVPHPRMRQRAFVLYPLYELAPELEIPGQGPLAGLLPAVQGQRVKRCGKAAIPARRTNDGN